MGAGKLRGFALGVDGAATSFYQAVVTDPAEPARLVQVVLNSFVPCWATADFTLDEEGVPVAELDLDFRWPPASLASAFTDVDLLSPDDARVRIAGEMLAVLAPAERRQVDYWNPETVAKSSSIGGLIEP